MPHNGYLIIYGRPAVCFRCRVALKDISVCPHCRQPMVSVGLNFEAPPRNKIRAWKRLKEAYKHRIATYPEHFKVKLTHRMMRKNPHR